MENKSIGMWYRQIPSWNVVNPLGKIVEPKFHNGSFYVVVERKMKVIKNLPQLTEEDVNNFKEVFCSDY